MEDSKKQILNGRNWTADFCRRPDCLFTFELYDAKISIKPVSIGDFSEGSGIIAKNQIHRRLDGLSQDCRMKTVIPFGVEPVVKRDVLFADGEMRVVVDIGIGGKAEYKHIAIEPLELEGEWRRIAVASCPESGEPLPEPEWVEINENSVIYQDSKPFLFCRIEDTAGRIVEIGNGDDLWRIGGATDLEGVTGEFKISIESGKIIIKRIPYIFPPEFQCGNRSWRFKWYVIWEQQVTEHANWEELEVDTATLPENIYAADCDGKRCPNMICWYAPAWRKAFKKAVRIAAARKAKIFFNIDNPAFCSDSGHMERSQKATLPHWDMMMRRELLLWAKQQMKSAGGDFTSVKTS